MLDFSLQILDHRGPIPDHEPSAPDPGLRPCGAPPLRNSFRTGNGEYIRKRIRS